MRKIGLVRKCFGYINGFKFLFFKILGLFFRVLFKVFRKKLKVLATLSRKCVNISDAMVENYIYKSYRDVYSKYEKLDSDDGDLQNVKIIWTAWLQGEKNAPDIIKQCLRSMNEKKENYQLNVITLNNLDTWLEVKPEILKSFLDGTILPAHFTDYIRMELLAKYGGVWLDATQYLTKPLPEKIWHCDLLVWNDIIDTTNNNVYMAIPFVEHFNNGFLVAKRNSSFYKFAREITEKILFDPIIKIDYFANFKAYFAGFDNVPLFRQQRTLMPVINPYGLITRQFWNTPITDEQKQYINDQNSFFFTLVYKENSMNQILGQLTIQEYIMENY